MDKYFTTRDQQAHIAKIDAAMKHAPWSVTSSEIRERNKYVEKMQTYEAIEEAKNNPDARKQLVQEKGLWYTLWNCGL